MLTLSDRQEPCFCKDDNCKNKKYREEHVKEFIKQLKWAIPFGEFKNIIDKLAGPKLI